MSRYLAGGVVFLILFGCHAWLPEKFEVNQLAFIAYQSQNSFSVLSDVQQVGEKRKIAWEQWLEQHRLDWNVTPTLNQVVQGKTIWCVQWQQNAMEQRICNRDNRVLVWFGYGQIEHADIIQNANKIWIGRY